MARSAVWVAAALSGIVALGCAVSVFTAERIWNPALTETELVILHWPWFLVAVGGGLLYGVAARHL